MSNDKKTSLESLIERLEGTGIEMPLSKFVELNFSVLKEFKKLNVPLNKQVEIIEKSIKKKVSPASFSVALSRLTASSKEESKIVIMEKKTPDRFVNKEARLVLGSQREKQKIFKKGVMTGFEDVLIDWRGLSPDESLTTWVTEYKDRLIAINHLGWRWNQISDAINRHLSLEKKLTVNTLTSIICIANKKNKTTKSTKN